VPNLGAGTHGFPYLNLPGLLVVKDCIMLGGGFVTLAESARAYLKTRAQ
jgi:reactive chlorine resistance protein C